jgi:hypothetical protein
VRFDFSQITRRGEIYGHAADFHRPGLLAHLLSWFIANGGGNRLFQYVSDVPGRWNLYCYGALKGCAGTTPMDLFVYWPSSGKVCFTNGHSPVQIEGNNTSPFPM